MIVFLDTYYNTKLNKLCIYSINETLKNNEEIINKFRELEFKIITYISIVKWG